MPGYIYVLVNESMPGLIKIGITERDPFTRASELSTTGVPTPFKVYATVLVENPQVLERRIHNKISDYRVSGSREFFRFEPKMAISLILESCENVVNVESPNLPELEDELTTAAEMLQEGPNFNPPKAKAILEKLTKAESCEAYILLGKYHSMFESEYRHRARKARKCYESAASLGSVDALYELALVEKGWVDYKYLDSYFNMEINAERLRSRAFDLFKAVSERVDREFPDVMLSPYFIGLHPNFDDLLWQEYKKAIEDEKALKEFIIEKGRVKFDSLAAYEKEKLQARFGIGSAHNTRSLSEWRMLSLYEKLGRESVGRDTGQRMSDLESLSRKCQIKIKNFYCYLEQLGAVAEVPHVVDKIRVHEINVSINRHSQYGSIGRAFYYNSRK